MKGIPLIIPNKKPMIPPISPLLPLNYFSLTVSVSDKTFLFLYKLTITVPFVKGRIMKLL